MNENKQNEKENYRLNENLTVPQVAEYLQIGLTKTWGLIGSNAIKSYKNGKQRRVKREWLLEFEKSLIENSS